MGANGGGVLTELWLGGKTSVLHLRQAMRFRFPHGVVIAPELGEAPPEHQGERFIKIVVPTRQQQELQPFLVEYAKAHEFSLSLCGTSHSVDM